jgi:arabinose-5-phosphate isomerase
MNIEINKNALEVIDLQIRALKKLKNSINKDFYSAIKVIAKCKSKVIVCGVGKSGIIASKISATLSSVGTPSFAISASDCSHGDLGKITNQDIVILISYSGNTEELKNIIKYVKLNKITLIGIVSNKNSTLYRSSNIKLLLPEVQESGYGIVPTSSTTVQLSFGDALAIALMKKKKFGKLDFKKYHPAGNLGNKLRTASDVMLINNKIPFVDENEIMKNALITLNKKKLGFLVLLNKMGYTSGVFTDGDLKRLLQKKKNIDNLKIKKFMSKKPFSVEENTLASEVLALMKKKKVTNICVFKKGDRKKTVGVVHIHSLLK